MKSFLMYLVFFYRSENFDVYKDQIKKDFLNNPIKMEEHEISAKPNDNFESKKFMKRPSQQSEPLIQEDNTIKDSYIQYAVNEGITSMLKIKLFCPVR